MGRTAEQLGTAGTFPADLLLGDLVAPGPGTLEVFPYSMGSPATGGLYRLRGDGWSWFCKVLQHVRHWSGLSFMPPAQREHFVASYPWRSELELWDDAYASRLPDGLRTPVLHGVVDLGDDRVAVWMEDVQLAPSSCGLDLFERAAGLLGRWNARCADPVLVAANGYEPGYALKLYAREAVLVRGLAPLEDDGLWSHPWLADHAVLREDLRRLSHGIPMMLARLDGYVQTIPHGDASPQNLLTPIGEPDTFVVIDVSFRTPHALGFDLGQLLVGLTHAGQVPASMLPEIAATIVPAYLAGLAQEGVTGQGEAVRDAFATSVMLRSGFDGFLYDLVGSESEEDRHAFDERVALSRFLVDHYLAVHPG
ncbi:MAG: phosphotransferase [Nocardioides sp.]